MFDSNGVQIGSASLNNSGVAVLNYAGLERRNRQLDGGVSGLVNFGRQYLQYRVAGGEAGRQYDIGDGFAQSFHFRRRGNHNGDGESLRSANANRNS